MYTLTTTTVTRYFAKYKNHTFTFGIHSFVFMHKKRISFGPMDSVNLFKPLTVWIKSINKLINIVDVNHSKLNKECKKKRLKPVLKILHHHPHQHHHTSLSFSYMRCLLLIQVMADTHHSPISYILESRIHLTLTFFSYHWL